MKNPLLPDDEFDVLRTQLDIRVTADNWHDVREDAIIMVYNCAAREARKRRWGRYSSDDLAMAATVEVTSDLDRKFDPAVPHRGTDYADSLTGYVRAATRMEVRKQASAGFHAETLSALAELERRLPPGTVPSNRIVAVIGKQVYVEWKTRGQNPIQEFWRWWRQADALPFAPCGDTATPADSNGKLLAIVEQVMARDCHGVEERGGQARRMAGLLDDLDGIVHSVDFQDRRRKTTGPYRVADAAWRADPDRRKTERRIATILGQIRPVVQWVAAFVAWAETTGADPAEPVPALMSDDDAAALKERYRDAAAFDEAASKWDEGEDSDLFTPFGAGLTPDQKDSIIKFVRALPHSVRSQVIAAWADAASRSYRDVALWVIGHPCSGPETAESLVALVRRRMSDGRA